MAEKATRKPVIEFERDFIRLMIGRHGRSYRSVAAALGRHPATVHKIHKDMIKDGTIGQLCLPGFEIEATADER